MASTFLTPSAVSRIAWTRIGFSTPCRASSWASSWSMIVDVPGPLDLRQHDDVELVADLGDDLDEVVERPGAVQRVDARPQPGAAEIVRLGERDEAAPRRDLGVGRDRVLEVAQQHVDLRDQLRDLGAELFVVRRHEMDHPLEPHRQLAIRRRRAGGERLEEAARKLGHTDTRSLFRIRLLSRIDSLHHFRRRRCVFGDLLGIDLRTRDPKGHSHAVEPGTNPAVRP